MDKVQELKAARAAKIDAFDALATKMNADNYVDTPEDTALETSLKADVAAFDARIERAEEAKRLKATVTVPVERTGLVSAQPRGLVSGLKHFNRPEVLAHLRSVDRTPEEAAYRFGQYVLAGIFGNDKAMGWCRENGVSVQKAQSEGVATAGGFLVPEEFSTSIIVLRDTYGLARQVCQVQPMGRDTITVPRLTSGLTAYMVGESTSDSPSAITASSTAWGQVRLTAKKLGVLTYLSPELDEDAAVNIGDILFGEIAYAYAKFEDTALFSGDATSTYGGIRGLRTIFNDGVASLKGSVDAASGHDTMAEIDATDLASVQGKLPQYVYERGTPKWYCSQTMWANVFERLIGASGGVTKDQASGGTRKEYNGYPVVITPAMLAPAAPTTDASDVAMILFGDIGMSTTFGDRRGMTLARSTDYKFAEDMIAIKGTERFDIVVHDYGDTSNPGPIVALMGE